MNDKILNDIYKLKEEVKKLDEFKDLEKANLALENSDEVKILSYKKDMAILNYEDSLKHFDKNSKECLKAEKEMAQAIYKLNHHDLVIEYNKKFKALENIYKKINHELFSSFMENKND